eukprot:361293-Prorocentrum_minimum.AAC.4
MGIAIAGLTADGRVLSRYMRSECINHRCIERTSEDGHPLVNSSVRVRVPVKRRPPCVPGGGQVTGG